MLTELEAHRFGKAGQPVSFRHLLVSTYTFPSALVYRRMPHIHLHTWAWDLNTGLTLAWQNFINGVISSAPGIFFFYSKEKMSSFCLIPCTPVTKTGTSSLVVGMWGANSFTRLYLIFSSFASMIVAYNLNEGISPQKLSFHRINTHRSGQKSPGAPGD